MRLVLTELAARHPNLSGIDSNYRQSGALAMQRSGHRSPADIRVVSEHDGLASGEWEEQPDEDIHDNHRITEDGAEAWALIYANALPSAWTVERRLQRSESADWLLRSGDRYLALEVSGTAGTEAKRRLEEKTAQVGKCTLTGQRMAVVVAFREPSIWAASV